MSSSAAKPSGLTLFYLDQIAHIGHVLHELQRQKGTLSLFATEAHSAAAAPLAEGQSPWGIASVVAVDAQARMLALLVTGLTQPPPASSLAIAHMAGAVRVQWCLEGAWQPVDGGGWQLTTTWPVQLVQLQRRRHPRWSVPLGQNYSAIFLFGNRRCVIDIEDVSVAGVALRGSRAETAMLFVGRSLPRVQLHLPDGVVLEVALQVRARRRFHTFLLGEQVLIGCSVEHMEAADQQALAQWIERGLALPTGMARVAWSAA